VTAATNAGFGRRFAALLYDSLLIAALLLIYTVIALAFTHGRAITEASSGNAWYVYRAGEVLLIGAYGVLNWMRSGQTLGMRAWRIHVLSDAGRPVSFGRAVLRFVFSVFAWLPLALGVLWLYLDPERLALQDRLSGTRVVRLLPSATPPPATPPSTTPPSAT
jgi:uncharacterized RDD family membrane protein YckC